MAWAWRQVTDPTTKFVLVALSDHANDVDFTCWPSLTHLQNKTGYSRPTVWKAIDKLVEIGLMTRVGVHSSGATLYMVMVGNLVTLGKDVTQVTTLPQLGNVGNKLGKDVTPNHKNHKEPSIGGQNVETRRFKPPTIEEVIAYCQERKNGINPRSFIDHYSANGWIRGKTKIKDWKACVRTWEARNTAQQTPNIFAGAK